MEALCGFLSADTANLEYTLRAFSNLTSVCGFDVAEEMLRKGATKKALVLLNRNPSGIPQDTLVHLVTAIANILMHPPSLNAVKVIPGGHAAS